MKKYLSILATVIGMKVFAVDIQPKIVNGVSTVIDNYPSLVSIYADGDFCGGSVISDKWILTAAHCISNSSNNIIPAGYLFVDIRPSAVVDDILVSAKTIRVKRVIRHPDYVSSTLSNDIALLELASSSETVANPVFYGNQSFVGTVGEIVGYGSIVQQGPTDTVTNIQPSKLQKADVTIRNNSECIDTYETNNDNICAGFTFVGGADACFGDSGGPLYITRNNVLTQIGLVSYGGGCGVGLLGSYTNIANYKSFIEKYTTANSADTTPTISNITGAWFDPSLSGLGFNVLHLPDNSQGLSVYYYGYKSSSEPLWLYSVSATTNKIVTNQTITLNMNESTVNNGASFSTPPTTAVSGTSIWGTINLTVHSCSSATAVLSGKDGTVTYNLIKLANSKGVTCYD